MNAAIFSLSWQNVDERVLRAQRRVFEHFGYKLAQHRIHGFGHGQWIDWVLEYHKTFDLFLFVDADAFPLNKQAVEEAFSKAAAGILYGNAQVSTHIDPSRLFAAPSWCAIARKTWVNCGCPSAHWDNYHDVAQRWTEIMVRSGVGVELLVPRHCVKPLWKLPDGAGYGIGTTFQSQAGAQVFHLFGVGGDTFVDQDYPPEARLRILEEAAVRVVGAPTP